MGGITGGGSERWNTDGVGDFRVEIVAVIWRVFEDCRTLF